jgi:serine/threonine protein kinase
MPGIIHGDIKLENVLIFPNKQKSISQNDDVGWQADHEDWIAKLIDFGYSCFGISGSHKVRLARTRPWQAPEHSITESVPLRNAKKMDIFSFGMLVHRVFLTDVMPVFTGAVGEWEAAEESLRVLDEIDSLKATPEFLKQVQESLRQSSSIPSLLRQRLQRIFDLTLHHDPRSRAGGFEEILSLLVEETTGTASVNSDGMVADTQDRSVFRPHLNGLNAFAHTILEVQFLNALRELD